MGDVVRVQTADEREDELLKIISELVSALIYEGLADHNPRVKEACSKGWSAVEGTRHEIG